MNDVDIGTVRKRVEAYSNWYHRIELPHGVVTPGINDCQAYLPFLQPPSNCAGLRVLDLGTRDGYFAFEYERRGATVIAVDYMARDRTGFGIAAELLNSNVEYVQANIYDLSVERFGTFDVVLFLGLLYHLPDPLGAIHRVRSVTQGAMFLETHILDSALLMPDASFLRLQDIDPVLAEVPLLQFYPGASLNRDDTNYFAPNLAALHGMLAECNFQIIRREMHGQRAIVEARPISDPAREHLLRIAEGAELP
jgi:tRNA (mo5U34)-methyltransferase